MKLLIKTATEQLLDAEVTDQNEDALMSQTDEWDNKPVKSVLLEFEPNFLLGEFDSFDELDRDKIKQVTITLE